METTMERIKTYREHGPALRERIEIIRQRVAAGVKWWAEHQSWPATDEIRIDRNRSTCG
jgi:hypothetical protein